MDDGLVIKPHIPMKYADAAMFQAEPMQVERDKEGNIVPVVHLLWMTPDPLGAAAAMNMMYRGMVVRNLTDVPDNERRKVLEDMEKTRLTAPLEAIKLHFMIEGVTRSFTHQMVRQRTAVYAQESLRFAVKDEPWIKVCSRPPSINTPYRREIWNSGLVQAEEHYKALIEEGVPAEDARGLMPHAMTTRLNYITDLRNLIDHAGNRLCTQAQFEWRIVFMKLVEAIRTYWESASHPVRSNHIDDGWQYEAIADSWMFRPVCYHTGKCEFMASADRFCSIRDRVQAFHAHGVDSRLWDARDYEDGDLMLADGTKLDGIFPAEWLADPAAAREGGSGH